MQTSTGGAPIVSISVNQASGRAVLHEAPPPVLPTAESTLSKEPSASGACPEHSTSHSNKSSTTRSQRWRNESSPPKDVRNMWRMPGILQGDLAYSKDPLEEVKSRREAEMQKRMAGEFLVSPVVNRIELPPALPCRAPPTQSPYDDAWRVGVAPAGRWVLERGRPRWVPELPSVSLTQSSVEAWFCGYRDVLPEAKSQSLVQYEGALDASCLDIKDPSKAVVGEVRQAGIVMKPTPIDTEDIFFMKSGGSSNDSSCGRSSSSDEGGKERKGNKSTQFAGGQDASGKRQTTMMGKSATARRHTSTRRQASTRRQQSTRQSRFQAEVESDIETVDDILRPLELASAQREESRDTIPRFSWVPLPTPNASMRDATYVVPCSQGTLMSSGQGGPAVGVKSSTQGKKQRVSMIKKGLISMVPQQTSRRSTNTNAAGESSKSLLGLRKETSNTLTLHSERVRRGSHAPPVGGSHPGGARSHSRDQRTELRRLNQSLMTSAQHAFDAEIWEACGIEAEHLKRHQFASLIQSGLFKLGGHKDDDNTEFQEDPVEDHSLLDPGSTKQEDGLPASLEGHFGAASQLSPSRKAFQLLGGQLKMGLSLDDLSPSDRSVAFSPTPEPPGNGVTPSTPRKSALKG